MAITEQNRHDLHNRLEEVLGMDHAATLMGHLPPVGWADVATKHDLDQLAHLTKHDLDQLAHLTKRDLELLEARIDGSIAKSANRLLFQLLAAQTAFISLVLVVTRLS